MALSDDDFVHQNKDFSVASASVVVALAGADSTTAGNSVVVFLGVGSSGVTAVPAGFVAQGAAGSTSPICYIKADVAASETSWTFTLSAAGDCSWVVLEVSNLETVEPLDVSTMSSQTSLSNGGTLATPAATSVGLSTVQFAVFYAAVISGTATKSWGSFTNDFTLIDQIDPTSGTNRPALAVTRTFNEGNTASYTSTGTLTISTGSAIACRARMYIFREKDSPVAAPLSFFTGWEFGTHGGMVDQTAISNISLLGTLDDPVGTWGTHYLVQAGSARNGGYGLRIATAAATAYVPLPRLSDTAGSITRDLRVVSGSGIPVVTTVDSSATDLELVYDITNTQYGLRWGSGGTVAWQDGTTALNTWVHIDVRYFVNGTTHTAVWRLETGTDTYTDQPAPADLTGQVASTVSKTTVGGMVSQTLTMDVDEVGGSLYYAAHPVGPYKVVLLKVDQAGTPTISGTSTNFSMFTANGTLAAWVAATAKTYLDEVPPTVSASADGVVQTAVAASDYMEFPMETYTLASDEVIAGVRVVTALWGGTGSATGTLGIRGWDGATETSLVPTTHFYDAGSPTAISSTEPWWNAAQWVTAGGWKQAKLDAACVRVGYSTDATPDMGVSAIYLEVAIRKTPVYRQITTGEADEFTVDLRVSPYDSSSVSYLITSTDAARGATFLYSVSGTPADPVHVNPSSTEEIMLRADDFGEISDLSLEPDPLP